MNNERRCKVVIEFDDGETHRVHPAAFALMVERFGGSIRDTFSKKCELVRELSGRIKSIRKEFS